MKLTVLFFLLLALPQMPKNDPNGIWKSASGTGYELHLKGSDLTVSLVPGSSSRYIEYEVKLKNTEEVNTYQGAGFFRARLENGKECRYDTEWTMVVVSPSEIIGQTTQIEPDPTTCEIKSKSDGQLQLKKQ